MGGVVVCPLGAGNRGEEEEEDWEDPGMCLLMRLSEKSHEVPFVFLTLE